MEGLEMVELFSTEMVLAVSENHPLATRKSVSLAALVNESFIDFSSRWSTRSLVDQILLKEGLARKVVCEVENFDLLSRLVMRGFGVSILPVKMIEELPLRSVKITSGKNGGAIQKWKLGIFRARNNHELPLNPAADVFQAMVEMHLNNQS
jgi:DNA-binding transcriptional LysR family regulator